MHRASQLQPWEYGPLDPSPDPLSNPWEPTLAESLRVTGVVRTLMDLGSVLRPAALEAAVEDALRREEDRFALVARRLGQA
ncbi:MAG TPA: hypothetical protein VFW71_10555, partial [Actinomycetota bacterium]|nr:hypothetical protein [Actinomycetota bacterium]